MSLTSLLRQPDVRARFRAEFAMPPYGEQPALLAPRCARHPQTVGIAFDYLLRGHIRHTHPGALEHRWIAEAALSRLPRAWRARGAELVLSARRTFSTYARTGRISTALLRSAIDLGRLDPVFRSRVGYELLNDPYDPYDLRDLRTLLGVVPPSLFRPADIIILNPRFGTASVTVGGADADLLIGDMLVEVKTIAHPFPTRDHFNQLVGYALLARLAGIDDTPPGHELRSVAFYSSRYGFLISIPLHSVLPAKLSPVLAWFKRRAQKHIG